MRTMRKLSGNGDTIVEVLISIAIVSVVLTGAFVAARRSLATTQRSQERGEATKLVEEQLERLKSAALKTGANEGIFAPVLSQPFCLNASASVVTGGGCVVGPEARYTARVTRGTGSDANTFTVGVVWEKLGGGQQEQISAVYRAYPK